MVLETDGRRKEVDGWTMSGREEDLEVRINWNNGTTERVTIVWEFFFQQPFPFGWSGKG